MFVRLCRILFIPFILFSCFITGCGGGGGDDYVGPAPANDTGLQVVLEPKVTAQTVSHDNLSLTIPGGLLTDVATVSIVPKQASAISPMPTTGMQSLGTFEVKLGNTSQFAQNLTLEWSYDPAKLSPDLPEGKGIVVCYYDETLQRWVEAPFTVDTEQNKLMVSTDHLSAWTALFWPYHASMPSQKKYFEVYYNSRSQLPGKDSSSWTDFATMVGNDLDTAYEKYAAMGFTMPETPIYAIIDESEDADASSGFFSSRIILPRAKLYSSGMIRNETAHELFHLIQFQIHTMTYLYNFGYWISEGTPDFAALLIWPDARETILKPTEFGYSSGFFEKPLWLDTKPEAYCLVFFLDYLKTIAKYDFNLKTLWSNFSSEGQSALTKHVESISGLAFSKVWENYLDYTFLDDSSPLIKDWQLQTLGVEIRDYNITLPPNSAKVEVFRNSSTTKTWVASPTSKIPEGVIVDLSKREFSTGKEISRTRLETVPVASIMGDKQTLIILFKNVTSETKTVKISVYDDDFLARMQQMTYCRAELDAIQIFAQTQPGGMVMTKYHDCWGGLNVGPDYSYTSGYSGHPTLTWQDADFTVTRTDGNYTYTISGKVDPLKKTVSARVHHSIVWPDLTSVYFTSGGSGSYTAEESYSWDIANIPVTVGVDDKSIIFEVKGPAAGQYVDKMSVTMNTNPNTMGVWQGTDWSGTIGHSSTGVAVNPNLKFTFWKK